MFGSVWDSLILVWDNFPLTHLPPTSQQTISPYPEIMIGKILRSTEHFLIFQVRDLLLRLNTASPYKVSGPESQDIPRYFVFDNFFSSVICMDFEIGQNLDFLKLGQRRLGMSGMDIVDVKVVCIGPL